MRKGTLMALAVMVIVVLLSGCQATPSLSGTDMITRILNSEEEGISYYLESRFEDADEESYISKEWHSEDGRYRVDMYEDGKRQSSAIFDGEELLSVDYTEMEVLVLSSSENPQILSQTPRSQTIQMLEALYDYYDIEVAEETKLLGRNVFVLELLAKNDPNDQMTIWVDQQNWVMLKSEFQFMDETIASVPLQFELNPQMDDDFFKVKNRDQFKTVTEEELDTSESLSLEGAFEILQTNLLVPRDTYVFSEGAVHHLDEEESVFDLSFVDEEGRPAFTYSALYQDIEGFERIFSIEEKRPIRQGEGYVTWTESIKFIYWFENGMMYSLNIECQLSENEALEIVESLEPYKGTDG